MTMTIMEMAHERSSERPFFLSDVGGPPLKALVLLVIAEATAVREQLADCSILSMGLLMTTIFARVHFLPKGYWGSALPQTWHALVVKPLEHVNVGQLRDNVSNVLVQGD